MRSNRVDRIIEQVEKIYHGDFLVNGDWESSQKIFKEYRERYSTEYQGTNGHFDVQKMKCTDICKRDGDKYLIPKGGIVFGPYFTFPAGDYLARFDIQGDLDNCRLSVFSQTTGDVASGIAVDNVRDGAVILPFLLSEKVPDLELRVSNQGDGQLIFLGVEVFDHLETPQERKTDDLFEERKKEDTKQQEIDWHLDTLDHGWSEIAKDMNALINMAQYNNTEIIDLQAAAPCELPINTRFRAVKRFFRKMLNSFICFQQAFNQMLVRHFHTVGTQISMLISAFKQSIDYQWKLRESERFCLEQIADLKRANNLQNEMISEFRNTLGIQSDKQNEVFAAFSELESRMAYLTEVSIQIKETLAKIQEKCEENERNEIKLMKYAHGLEKKIAQGDNTDQILNEVGVLWNRIEEAAASLRESN